MYKIIKVTDDDWAVSYSFVSPEKDYRTRAGGSDTKFVYIGSYDECLKFVKIKEGHL